MLCESNWVFYSVGQSGIISDRTWKESCVIAKKLRRTDGLIEYCQEVVY